MRLKLWEILCIAITGLIANWLWGLWIALTIGFVMGFIMGVLDGLSKGGKK